MTGAFNLIINICTDMKAVHAFINPRFKIASTALIN